MRNIFIFSFFHFIVILAAVQAATPDGAHGPLLLDNEPVSTVRGTAGATSAIRINVNLTLVPVTVTDEFGANFRGLGKQNFQIYDGSEPRPIVSFSQEDAPVSVGLVFDCSRSMRDKFQSSRDAASQLFKRLNPDQDEAFLVTISGRALLRQDFTSNFGDIGEALTFVRPDGTTSLSTSLSLT
jgi:Ca-activated chloride channel homolog